ncbi:MAG: hemerythrin domain-containing protein [Actinomycetota bacterium]|jgi:hemerythrin superfamily protein|nr:hemerythrin domain-containing protein [Actinomycetota bacterium]
MAETQNQETQDIVDAVLEDHERFRRLFADFEQATGGQRSELWQALVRGLAVHETAEEEIVHPQVRRWVDGGDDIVDERLAEEDAAKKELADLEKLGADDDEFESRVRAFMEKVFSHADAEEGEELPALRTAADDDTRRRMARIYHMAKTVAPTHAHKMAPESATGNVLIGPVVALMDRVRDAIRDAMAHSK